MVWRVSPPGLDHGAPDDVTELLLWLETAQGGLDTDCGRRGGLWGEVRVWNLQVGKEMAMQSEVTWGNYRDDR